MKHESKTYITRNMVLLGLLISGVSLLAIHIAALLVFRAFQGPRNEAAETAYREAWRRPAGPILETGNEALTILRREEAEMLETYGWIDREKEILRLPINRAIDVLLNREGPGNE